ncbi:DUF4435 domain-containing protein [Malikia sp.]|uniref:DUF4435 domain-containing protein n=1 Tax=Malikia sp. TaxID=2070706 RepID=UPI0026145E3D|nr:DUF4435 domain-containing protein [Malikia sp.]MDD2729624.1 DUF4435 domain-containing protein [Malikia sp.]
MALPILRLPASGGGGGVTEIPHNGSVVIVGANGSGKSRLGTWIERNTGGFVHRISAQRGLDVPEYTQLKSLEQSTNDLLWGNENPQYANAQYKWGHRWGNRPETFLQQDYGKVLSALFAANAERDRKHSEETRIKQQYIPVPDSPIDKLVRLWREILPHRIVAFEDGKIVVRNQSNGASYHGKEMSDGERVALYLMGQVLLAPAGSILVIDEPEIHLHSSIMQSMWDKLEEEKDDCLFVFITHDLNFASTRVSTTNIWVRDFDGANTWTWEFVSEVEEFPESLLLELLGNRRTVVFVEGEKGGKDHSIYQAIYRNYNVVPRNGCDRVIESTKALRINKTFHHVDALGLIDRDYRTEEEIAALTDSGVHCVEVAEVENILLNEHTLRTVAANQKLNPDEVLFRATVMVRGKLSQDIERQASLRTMRAVEHLLRKIDSRQVGGAAIKVALDAVVASINVQEIYGRNIALYHQLADGGSLDEILRYYNNKGLVQDVCSIFELGRNGYEKLVLRMLNSDEREAVLAGLRQYVPQL